MKINEIIVESQQLDEGPLGKAIGRGFGKAVQGVGAVAGGIAAAPGVFKKGFDAGKKTVSSVGTAAKPAAKAKPAAPAAKPVAKPVAKPAQTAPTATQEPQLNLPSASKTGFLKAIDQLSGRDDFTSKIEKEKAAAVQAAKAGIKPTTGAQPATKTTTTTQQPQASAATTQQQPAPTAATQSAYKQVKTNIDQLDKKGKQRLLNLLQKSLAQHSSKPAAKPTV